MSFGRISSEQHHRLRQLMRAGVDGRGPDVVDLGAGDLTYAHLLVSLGAERVIAVDKEPMPEPARAGVERLQRRFEDCPVLTPDEVAFISWPPNNRGTCRDLVGLIQECNRVVYLGTNRYPNACGMPELFEHFCDRELLVEVDESNGGGQALLAYGLRLSRSRPPTLEEHRGLTAGERTNYPVRCPFPDCEGREPIIEGCAPEGPRAYYVRGLLGTEWRCARCDRLAL
jgi:hypothetical protein